MKSKLWFTLGFIAIATGCSLDDPGDCPIFLNRPDDTINNPGDIDGDETPNCWDACPYNKEIKTSITKNMIETYPLTEAGWVYVCNLNNEIQESESAFTSSFKFDASHSVFHIFNADDIDKYRQLAEKDRITGLVFHGTINLADTVKRCEDLDNWESITIPDTTKFTIRGDEAVITAHINNANCPLKKPLFTQLNHAEISDLSIKLDATTSKIEVDRKDGSGPVGVFGLLSETIDNSDLANINLEGQLTAGDHTDNANIGLLAGMINGSHLNKINISNSTIVINQFANAFGGIAGTIENTQLNEIHQKGISIQQSSSEFQLRYVGGAIGKTKDSELSRFSLEDTKLNIGNVKIIGGIVASLSKTTLLDSALTNTSISCSASETLGGIVGYAGSKSKIVTTSHNLIKIDASETIDAGAIVGQSNDSYILECNITNTSKDESCYMTFKAGTHIGSFAGSLNRSELSGGSLSDFKITVKDHANHVGGLVGNAIDQSYVSGSSMSNLSLNLTSPAILGGGIAGYMNSSEMRGVKLNHLNITITDNTDNTPTELQNTNDKTTANDPNNMFQLYLDKYKNYTEITISTKAGLEGVGGIAGRIDNSNIHSTTVENYSIDAANTNNIGGAVGFMYASELISNEIKPSGHNVDPSDLAPGTMASIKGMNYVGGVAGRSWNSDINNTNVVSEYITGKDYVGGLIGHALVYGNAADKGEYVNTIHADYIRSSNIATNQITGNKHVGGYIGSLSSSFASPMITWSASQVLGELSSKGEMTGGFIGDIDFGCDDYVAISSINSTVNTINGNDNTGGFIGQIKRNDNITSCHITTDVDVSEYLTLGDNLKLPIDITINIGSTQIPIDYDYKVSDETKAQFVKVMSQIINTFGEGITNTNLSELIAIDNVQHTVNEMRGTNMVGGLIGHIKDNIPFKSNVAISGVNLLVNKLTGPEEMTNVSGVVGSIDHVITSGETTDENQKTFKIGSSTLIVTLDDNIKYGELTGALHGNTGLQYQCMFSMFPNISDEMPDISHIFSIPETALTKDTLTLEGFYNSDRSLDAYPNEPQTNSELTVYDDVKDTIYIESNPLELIENHHKDVLVEQFSKMLMGKLNQPTFVAQIIASLKQEEREEILSGKYNHFLDHVFASLTDDDYHSVTDAPDFYKNITEYEYLLQIIRNGQYRIKTAEDNIQISTRFFSFGKQYHPSYYFAGAFKCLHQYVNSTDENRTRKYNECKYDIRLPTDKRSIMLLYMDSFALFNRDVCSYTNLSSLLSIATEVMRSNTTNVNNLFTVFSLQTPELPVKKSGL